MHSTLNESEGKQERKKIIDKIIYDCFIYNKGKEGITTVAVKTLKENATEAERQDLHSELNVSYIDIFKQMYYNAVLTSAIFLFE